MVKEKIPKWDGTYKWETSTIQSMLSNEKYKGDAELQKGYTANFLTKRRECNNGELQKFYIEEDHEPIIDAVTWECVQLEMKRRSEYVKAHSLKAYSHISEQNPFYGKVICGECGCAFGRKTWQNKHGESKKMWQCGNRYRVKGVSGCLNRHIADASINQVFIIAWNTIIENIDTCREKWRLLAEGDDVLKAYRAKDLLAITEEPWEIREINPNFVIRVLDYITVHESGKIVITFYDGTEIEYS